MAQRLAMTTMPQFRNIFDALIEGVQIHDFNWKYLYVNDALVKYSHYTREGLLGFTLTEKYPGIEQTDLFKTLQRCMTERVAEKLDTEFVFPDGTIAYFELSIQPIPEGIFILSVDRTERQKAKEKLLKVNRLYAFNSAINQSIVQISDQQELFNKVCDIALEIGQFEMAWIDLVDIKSGKLNMESVSGMGSSANEAKKHSGSDHDSILIRDTPTGRALATGQIAVSNDVQNDIAMLPWKEKLVEHGIRSFISLPIKKFGKVVGIFGLNSKIENFFDHEEIVLLREAADDISFSLENYERAKSHMIAEHNLIESEKKYRHLFENNPMPMWIIDLRTFKFLDVNQMAIHKYGYSREEFLAMTALDIRPEDDRPHFLETFRSLDTKVSNYKKDVWNHRMNDGRIIKAEIIAHTVLFEGYPARLILANDVTESKMAQENLLLSESRLKEAQALGHIGNWEIDLVNNIHIWSEEFYKIFGIKKDEVQPSAELFLSFMHPDDSEFAKKKMRTAFETLQESSFNFCFIHQDGSTRHGYTEWRFEFDKNNTPIRLFGILQDVTQRKEAEIKLEQQNQELVKTNSELDSFVYSVSHDLRSPLTSVLGLVSFIEEETAEDDTLAHAKMIRSSIGRLDDFIKNILSYSQNNRTELEIEVIHVEQTVNEIVESLRNISEAKRIRFEVNIDEKEPFSSNPQRFRIVMENLISNAIKFSNKDAGDSFIKVQGYSDHEKLEIRIIDNGIGISEIHHSKIFDMFFRLSGQVPGSGIGLYIVKETIEKLNGTIEVHSELGKGTTFTITLKNLKDT